MTDSSSDSADTVISVPISRPALSPATPNSLSVDNSPQSTDSERTISQTDPVNDTTPDTEEASIISDSPDKEQRPGHSDDMGNRLGGERKKKKDEPPPEKRPDKKTSDDKPKKRGKKSKGKSKRNSQSLEDESASAHGATAASSSSKGKSKSKSKRPDVLADLGGSQAHPSPLGSPESASGSQGTWDTESDVSTLGYSTPLLSTPQVQRYVLPKQQTQQNSTERLEELGRSIEKTILDKLSDQPVDEPPLAASASASTSCEKKGRRNVRKKRNLGQAVIDTDSLSLPLELKADQTESKTQSPQSQRHLGTEKISLRASQESPVSPWLRDDDIFVDEEQMDEMFISCIDLSYNLADICSEKEFTEYGSLDSKKHPKPERERSKETSLSPRIARRIAESSPTPWSNELPLIAPVSRDSPQKSDSSTSTLADMSAVIETTGFVDDAQIKKKDKDSICDSTTDPFDVKLKQFSKSSDKLKSKGKRKYSKEKTNKGNIPSEQKPVTSESVTLEVASHTTKESTPVDAYDNLCITTKETVDSDSVYDNDSRIFTEDQSYVDECASDARVDPANVNKTCEKTTSGEIDNNKVDQITFIDRGEAELTAVEETLLQETVPAGTIPQQCDESKVVHESIIQGVAGNTGVIDQNESIPKHTLAGKDRDSMSETESFERDSLEISSVDSENISNEVLIDTTGRRCHSFPEDILTRAPVPEKAEVSPTAAVEKPAAGSEGLSPEGAASPKHVPPPSPSALDVLCEIDEEDEEALEALEDNSQMNEVQLFGETVFKRLSSLVESQSQDEESEERYKDFKDSDEATLEEDTDSPPVNLGSMTLMGGEIGHYDTGQAENLTGNKQEHTEDLIPVVEEEVEKCSGISIERIAIPCTKIEIHDNQLSKEDADLNKDGESWVDDDTLKRKKKKKRKKEQEKQKRESIGSIVKKPEIPAELKQCENTEGSPSLRRKAGNEKDEKATRDPIETDTVVPKRESQQIREVIDAYGFEDSVDVSDKPNEHKYIEICPRYEDDDEDDDESDTSYVDDSKSSERSDIPSSSSFELSSRRIPEIEETFSELLSVKHILEDLEDRTPTEEGLPPFVRTGELRSPPEHLNGRRSRMSPAVTDRTESDLDISEQRDDISTDSMYADDEDDGTEVLFSRSYSEPDGTEAVVSCTFYNTTHTNNNTGCDSDDFWEDYTTADESFKQIEISADAASSTFQNARKQMHDIHQHLQDLRRQMEYLQEEVESATLTPEYSMDSEDKRPITE